MPPVSANRHASLQFDAPPWRATVCGFDVPVAASEPAGIDGSQLWNDLKSGKSSVVDSFSTDERHYLIIGPSERSLVQRGTCRAADGGELEAWLRGSPQKCIGIDRDLTPSTISMRLRANLNALGLSCQPSRVPLLLVVLARMPRLIEPETMRVREHRADGKQFLVVQMLRPDAALKAQLSTGEFAVIRALVDGQAYREIATQRQTSARTVANQIAAAFRKLRVSGRLQLLCLLAERSLGAPPSPERRAGVSLVAPPPAHLAPPAIEAK